MTKKPKVSIYLDEKDHRLLKIYAEKMKTTFSGAATIAINLGLMTMKFAEDPKMKKYFEMELDQIINEKQANGK
jgi:hypothetical protein